MGNIQIVLIPAKSLIDDFNDRQEMEPKADWTWDVAWLEKKPIYDCKKVKTFVGEAISEWVMNKPE